MCLSLACGVIRCENGEGQFFRRVKDAKSTNRRFYCSAAGTLDPFFRSLPMSREPPKTAPWARTVHGAAMPAKLVEAEPRTEVLPTPEMFDVVTYFLNRGDSWTVIASIGFWIAGDPRKALSASALKRWYQTERARRATNLDREAPKPRPSGALEVAVEFERRDACVPREDKLKTSGRKRRPAPGRARDRLPRTVGLAGLSLQLRSLHERCHAG
jgi:hypothetical protein